MLRWSQRHHLRQEIARDIDIPALSSAGRRAAIGIGATSVALLAASAFGVRLGLPTFAAGAATAALVLTRADFGARALVRGISWGILPLVAGLFVLVQGLQNTGLIGRLAGLLQAWSSSSADAAASGTGVALALACNLMNNLPAGLLAGRVMQATQVPDAVRSAVLIGVDLGPNLSVTGSLATLLWLTALRREGIAVSAWSFLKLGALVMPPALLLALAGVVLPAWL
jgi:arsenical pump membrane protein